MWVGAFVGVIAALVAAYFSDTPLSERMGPTISHAIGYVLGYFGTAALIGGGIGALLTPKRERE
jgi:hypothetical protein